LDKKRYADGVRKIGLIAAAALLLSANVRGEMTILAASRNGWVEFIDPNTLEVKGRLDTGKTTDSAVASADGKTLFITKPRPSEPDGCCALYAIDLKQRSTTEMLWPSGEAVVAPKSNRIFTQRGNIGIEVFASDTLKRMPAIEAPGVYGLAPSPDGAGCLAQIHLKNRLLTFSTWRNRLWFGHSCFLTGDFERRVGGKRFLFIRAGAESGTSLESVACRFGTG